MKKTVYTCDFCIKEFPANRLKLIDIYEICDGCNHKILAAVIANPMALEPYLILTPFCKKCKGTRKITETDFNGIDTCKHTEHCPDCT